MNFKKLYMAGLTACTDKNYKTGACVQHHGESIEDANVGVRITYLPANYEGRIIIKVESLAKGLALTGGYQSSIPFSENQFKFITDIISKSGQIVDTELTYNASSTECAFDIKFKASKSWLQGFKNYRDMKDVFNFTQDERAKTDKFRKQWNKRTKKYLKLFKEL